MKSVKSNFLIFTILSELMNKTELTSAIAEKANLTKAQAKAALDATLNTIAEQLGSGQQSGSYRFRNI